MSIFFPMVAFVGFNTLTKDPFSSIYNGRINCTKVTDIYLGYFFAVTFQCSLCLSDVFLALHKTSKQGFQCARVYELAPQKGQFSKICRWKHAHKIGLCYEVKPLDLHVHLPFSLSWILVYHFFRDMPLTLEFKAIEQRQSQQITHS